MLWLWIPAVVVLLMLLLLWTRVGVWASLEPGGILRLDLRFGFWRIHILPAKPKKPREKKPEEKKKSRKSEKPETRKAKLSIALEDIKDAARTLLPALGRALGRTRRGIRFKPLRVSLVLGGQEDPAASAQLCGEIQAAVWTGMPVLERMVDIRDPYIHTDVDFSTPETVAQGEAGVTFRVGTLLAIGFGLAVPALKWFLRWRKRCKTRPPKPGSEKGPEETPPEPPEAAEENDSAA